MRTGRIGMVIHGRRVDFVSPESSSRLMFIPIISRQSRPVGLKVMPRKGYKVNVQVKAARPEMGNWDQWTGIIELCAMLKATAVVETVGKEVVKCAVKRAAGPAIRNAQLWADQGKKIAQEKVVC